MPLPLPEDFSPEVQRVLDDANVSRDRLLRLTLALLMATEVAADHLAQQWPGYETAQVLQKQLEQQVELYREFYDRLLASSP